MTARRSRPWLDLGNNLYRSGELVSAAWDCDDIVRFIVERFSDPEDVLCEVVFLDKRIQPNLFEQFLFQDDVASAGDEGDEHLKCLWRQRNLLSTRRRIRRES